MINEELSNLYFECKSGILLWGHLHTILEGYLSNEYDYPLKKPKTLNGGTILQKCYNYRVKAKKGIWKISSIFSRNDIKYELKNTGYIVYNKNIDIDPVNIVRRCSKVGISLKNTHSDNKIIYINRYDWGFHHKIIDNNISDQIENILGGKDEKHKLDNMFGCRLIVIDSESILNILDQLKKCSLKTQIPGNELFNKITMNCILKEKDKEVGIHLNIPETEYEIGWLVYNDIDELIAIVYDKYNVLEGELKVDDKVAINFEEYNEIIEKRKEIEKKGLEKYQLELEENNRLNIE